MKAKVLVLVTLAMLAVMPALAQSVVDDATREGLRGVPDTWGFSLGSFWQTFNSKVRLDGKNQSGDWVNLERDFGLNRTLTDFNFEAFYRFSPHHRLELSYTTWNRSYSKSLSREIHWGDAIYEAGATLTASNKANLANVIYRYSFFNNGKVEFGVNAGISALWMETKLSGEGTITGGGTLAGTIAESKSVIAPIPVVGAAFEMTLTSRWFWRAQGNFFAANVAGFNGNLQEWQTSTDYFVTKNVGLGAGFASTFYHVTKSSKAGDFALRYGFSGVTAYAKFVF